MSIDITDSRQVNNPRRYMLSSDTGLSNWNPFLTAIKSSFSVRSIIRPHSDNIPVKMPPSDSLKQLANAADSPPRLMAEIVRPKLL